MSSSSLSFSKFHGSGNDFILVDNREPIFPKSEKWIFDICHRKYGIGADGVILVENSSVADFRMRIFNADGKEAESCGNGLCCFFRFLLQLGEELEKARVEIPSGIVELHLERDYVVVKIADLISSFSTHELFGGSFRVYWMDTGVPHVVHFVDSVKEFDVLKWGGKIRNDALFAPQGTNVNFAQVHEDGLIEIRTFERGVENETLACGTGATAVALVAMQLFQISSPVRIRCLGGDVEVEGSLFQEGFKNVFFKGNAEFVFSGVIDMNQVETKLCRLGYQRN